MTLLKLYFPYGVLRGPSDLLRSSLPAYGDFFSTILHGNVLEEEHSRYQVYLEMGYSEPKALAELNLTEPLKSGPEIYSDLQNLWRDKGFTQLHQFLVEYNRQDVIPLQRAVEKMVDHWRSEKNIDPFEFATISSMALPIIM